MRRLFATLALGASLLASQGLLADEMWALTDGTTVYYESDIGNTAVFAAETADGTLRLYLEGLPGSLDARGVYTGYWIGSLKGIACGATITGPDGMQSDQFGWLTVSFAVETFPSAWTADLGDCFGDYAQTIDATPTTGQ